MIRSRLKLLALIVGLLAPFGLAQQVQQQVVAEKSAPPKPEATTKTETDKSSPKISKEDKQTATQLLELSEAQARGFEAPMRSFSLLQIAQVYVAGDPAKARELLKDAFTASLGIQDDDRTKSRVQNEIFLSLLPLSQADVEELLPQAQGDARKQASEAIISRYVDKKQFEPAMELVTEITRLDEFPYGSATRMLLQMPPEMNAEKMTLFVQAVNSYKSHEHPGLIIGDASLTNMVVRFGPQMPPKLVMQAIDEILAQAKKNADHSSITIGGEGGTVNFASVYEYQLFALLPLLEQIDESRAKSLLEENQSLQARMTQFSNGLVSIDPSLTSAPAKHGGMHSSVSSHSGQVGVDPADYLRQEAMRKAEDIVSNSGKNPIQAIAQAAALPVKIGGVSQCPRCRALEGIARANLKNDPKTAKAAVDELRKAIADLPPSDQVRYLGDAGNLYLQLGEPESVEKLVSEGFKVGDKLLEKDLDQDDPNKALKAWWPSVDAYRHFIELETKVSQPKAIKMLTEIKDPEIRAVETIMVSRAMLGVPVKQFVVMEVRSNGKSVSSSSYSDK